MATTTVDLAGLETVTYNGNNCIRVDFGNACVWTKPYTLTFSQTSGFGANKSVNYEKTSTQCTISAMDPSGAYTSNWLGTLSTYSIRVWYGDVISITTTSTTKKPEYNTYTIHGDTTVNFVDTGSGGSNPGTGGGTTTITFTFDGVSRSVSSGTTWSTLSSSVLGHPLFEDSTSGTVTPVNGSTTGPWVIDNSTQEPVFWTDTIKDGGVYFISG